MTDRAPLRIGGAFFFSWPTARTAAWIGLGIGDPEVATAFRTAWDHAQRNHLEESHRGALIDAARAQRSKDVPLTRWQTLTGDKGVLEWTKVLISVIALCVLFVQASPLDWPF